MQATTIQISRGQMLHHFFGDYAGFGLLATLILTIPVQEIGIVVPVISGVLVLFGQGVRWYRDDQRKQKRHELFERLAEKMINGDIPFNKDFLEKLDDDN